MNNDIYKNERAINAAMREFSENWEHFLPFENVSVDAEFRVRTDVEMSFILGDIVYKANVMATRTTDNVLPEYVKNDETRFVHVNVKKKRFGEGETIDIAKKQVFFLFSDDDKKRGKHDKKSHSEVKHISLALGNLSSDSMTHTAIGLGVFIAREKIRDELISGASR